MNHQVRFCNVCGARVPEPCRTRAQIENCGVRRSRNGRNPQARPLPPISVFQVIDLQTALANIVAHAVMGPDPTTQGATDCYRVPLDDIEAARAVLKKYPTHPLPRE